jgi:type IX secretion system PorP/SprF family membrane protein
MVKFRNILLLVFVVVLQTNITRAQQDPMYSLYLHDKALINPAYVGSSNWVVGTLKYRTQFIGIPGAPVTQTFNFHTPIQKKHIGLGVKIVNDKVAVVNTLNASGLFSYHLGLAGGKLSAGIETGIISRKVNFPDLIKKDQADNSLSEGVESRTVIDAAGGLYYHKKNFYLGLSSMHLPNSKFKYGINNSEPYAHMFTHYYMYIAQGFELSENVYLEPSMLVKRVVAAPVQIDLNALVSFRERISIGVSYRTGDAFCGIVKIGITEQLKIAYAYDHLISKLSTYSSGAHEIMVSYGIKLLPPAAEKEVHPRFYF